MTVAQLDRQGHLAVPGCSLRALPADPAAPRIGEFWFRTDTGMFSVQAADAVYRIALI